MKASELRKMTVEELRAKFREFKEELFNLRFQKVTGQLTNTIRIRQVRRSIARVSTVLREKELGINKHLVA